jgi:transposase
MSDTRRIVTEDFKREAVRLAQERGNIRATARDLGINVSTLSRWKFVMEGSGESPSPSQKLFPGNGNPRDPEVAKLEREVARLQEENAILKKTVGIFVKDRK